MIESVLIGVLAAIGAVALVMAVNLMAAPVRMQRMADQRLRNSRAANERLKERLRSRATPSTSGYTINFFNIGDTSAQVRANEIVNAMQIAQSQGTTRTASGIILPASVSLPQSQPLSDPEQEA